MCEHAPMNGMPAEAKGGQANPWNWSSKQLWTNQHSGRNWTHVSASTATAQLLSHLFSPRGQPFRHYHMTSYEVHTGGPAIKLLNKKRIKKKEIYLSLELLEKFQNLELDGNKLRYKLRKPFDSMVKNQRVSFLVLEVGLEPTKAEAERFTVSCHCH